MTEERATVRGEWWWALRRGPNALPVVFSTKRDAVENCDPDEAIYRVRVINSRLIRRAKTGQEGRETKVPWEFSR